MAHHLSREYEGGLLVEAFETTVALFSAVADRFCRVSEVALSQRGRFAAALSGGKTPVDLYLEIAQRGGGLDWEKIHLFLVDERYVPYDDSRSNFGMIRQTLVRAVPLPAANVHAVPVDEADPANAARRYEREVLAFFGDGQESRQQFDLVMLGLGENGHTASLFPGSPALEEKSHLVLAVAPEAGAARITFTFPLINNARDVWFLVTGKAKAEMLRRVVEERDRALPAALVMPRAGRLVYFCDKDAASLLEPRGEARA